MKLFNQARRYGAQLADRGRYVAALVVTSAPVLALAQATDPFTTVIDEVTAKVETYAGALVVLGGVAVLFMVGLKYVKKIPRAS